MANSYYEAFKLRDDVALAESLIIDGGVQGYPNKEENE